MRTTFIVGSLSLLQLLQNQVLIHFLRWEQTFNLGSYMWDWTVSKFLRSLKKRDRGPTAIAHAQLAHKNKSATRYKKRGKISERMVFLMLTIAKFHRCGSSFCAPSSLAFLYSCTLITSNKIIHLLFCSCCLIS